LQLRSLLSTATATRMARRRQRLPSVQDLPGAGPQRGQLPLHHLIEIAHRNHWIQADAQKFSHVLRDYRNLVHVPVQFRIGDVPDGDTFNVCWYVVVATLNDLAATAPRR
jgi:hypothetical protein